MAFFVDYDNLNETCSIASGCGNASNSQENAGEAESKGLEITYKVKNLFPSPSMKGAEATSGVRYQISNCNLTLQDSEQNVTTSSSKFVDGQNITV